MAGGENGDADIAYVERPLPGDGALLLFRVADDAITEVGEVSVSVTDATRVLRAGDLLYVTSPGGCTVVQASDGTSVGQADIAVG